MQTIATILYVFSAWFWFCSAKMHYTNIDLGEVDKEIKLSLPKTFFERLCPFAIKNLEYHSYAYIMNSLNFKAAGCAGLAILFDRILPLLCNC